jgi:hypothetical protein
MISIDEIQLVRDGYIGWQPSARGRGKDYIFVDIALRNGKRSTTIEHASVEEYLSLSICGTIWATRNRTNRDCDSAGQIERYIHPTLVTPALGITQQDIKRLRRTWERWHLNDMRPNCDHQEKVSPPPADLATIPACPETGYRYGHAWLLEPLPAEVEAWVREFAAKLSK